MVTTNFLVKKRKISQIDSIPYTGEDNIDTFKFEFDEGWEGLDKTLVIVSGSHRYNIALLHDQCVVPFEFYQIKGNVLIGLFGTDGTYQTLATGWLPIYVEEDSYEVGVEPDNLPTQTQWDAFVTEINNLLEQAEASEEHCAEILEQMQEDYETYLASLNQIKDDTEDLKDQTQTIKNETNQIKTDVQGLKRQIEQDIADAELRIDEYNANAQAKTNEFNNNYNTKLGSFNDNATSKTNTFNSNVESKTNTFNQNATNKTNTFNNNATQKTTSFNDNATSKTTAFNNNAQEKLDAVTQAGTTAIDNIEDAEETTIEHIQEAGESYDEKIAELEEDNKLIISNYNTAVAEGDNIHITDSLNAKPEMIVVKGKVTQVQTTGKNKFDISNLQSVNNSTISTTNGVTTITRTHDTGYNAEFEAKYEKQLKPNTTYTLKLKNTGTISLNSNRMYAYSDSLFGTALEKSNYENDGNYYKWNITTDSSGYIVIGFFTATSSTTGDKFIFEEIQLEEGSEATSYEPYTNEQSAPNPNYQVPIVDTNGNNEVGNSNKNLYDFKDTKSVTPGIVISDDGWVTVNYDNSSGSAVKYLYCYTHNLNLKTNKHYLIVTEIKNVSGAGGLTVVSNGVSAGTTGQFLTNIYKSFSNLANNSVYTDIGLTRASFETSANGLRTIIQFAAGQSGSIKYRLSVLEDTTITAETFSYVPFKGSNNQLRLGDIYLGDLNEAENLLFKNVEREDNPYYDSTLEKDKWYWLKEWTKGTITITGDPYETEISRTFLFSKPSNSLDVGTYELHAMAECASSVSGSIPRLNGSVNRYLYGLRYPIESTITKEQLKALVDGSNFIYALNVPQKILITDENLLEDLANMEKNMRTYKNITEIYCVSNSGGNAPVVQLTYLKDDRVEIENRLSALEQAFVAQNSNN